jgi:hypothetical protein
MTKPFRFEDVQDVVASFREAGDTDPAWREGDSP